VQLARKGFARRHPPGALREPAPPVNPSAVQVDSKIGWAVRDSIRIGRPIDLVRRQFGDVRHHAERGVHRGVLFTVLSESVDQCRYRHETRVAGMRQIGEVVLTRQADGSQTNLFTSGSNTGMKITHDFRPDGSDATIATVTIELPVRGARRLLAPLIRLVVGRDLARGLEEDRLDLEEGGYPDARVRPRTATPA
jgi:hypothetical protein